MRCPDCSKFVAYDTKADPEENSLEFDGTSFTADYRRVLPCAECGTELKAGDISLELTLLPEDMPVACTKGEEHDWTVSADATSSSMLQDIDRNGKKIKHARYMKMLYGIEVEFTAVCALCGLEVTAEREEYIAASEMDEQV